MSIEFGTSGLRGPAEAFAAQEVAAYVLAFLDLIGTSGGSRVFLGSDMRASSPEISAHCATAIRAAGMEPVWCGVVPTPALAWAALKEHAPAIMVTGSHIPADRNGIKFYRREGELLKSDEAPIHERAARYLAGAGAESGKPVALADPEPGIARAYVARYLDAFAADTLAGLRIGLYQHAAAGRDLLAEILTGLGAEIMPFGRSGRFIAVDTEALDPHSLAACRSALTADRLDAIVSTDGDGDRPLLIDETGAQVNGDVLCALAARALGIAAIVTPLTATSAIDLSAWFDTVIRTKIGSPYVIQAMQESKLAPLAGFEPNGGFLLSSALELPAGQLSPLPTRDAVLPLIAVLSEANRTRRPLSDLVTDLPPRFMKPDRIKNVQPERSRALLEEIARSAQFRRSLDPRLEFPGSVDVTDGLRFALTDGSIIQFRPSGNAPELRCYVETDSAAETDRILARLISALEAHMQKQAQSTGRGI